MTTEFNGFLTEIIAISDNKIKMRITNRSVCIYSEEMFCHTANANWSHKCVYTYQH